MAVYQGQAKLPFYQRRNRRIVSRFFSNGLQIRHYPAQSIYQRRGKAISKQKGLQIPYDPRQRIYPLFGKRSGLADPMAVLSRQKLPNRKTSRFDGPMAVLLRQKQLTPRDSTFHMILTKSLSSAKPSFFQRKAARWPLYQERPPCQRQARAGLSGGHREPWRED